MGESASAPRPIAPGLFTGAGSAARLLAARCPACRRLHFPASSTCPYCATDGCAETHVGPAARLRLFTVIGSRPPGYRGEVPYGFGVVELDEGLTIVTRLTEARLERLRRGLPMTLVVEPLFVDEAGHPVLSWAFRPEAP